jgi:hypothetical protein
MKSSPPAVSRHRNVRQRSYSPRRQERVQSFAFILVADAPFRDLWATISIVRLVLEEVVPSSRLLAVSQYSVAQTIKVRPLRQPIASVAEYRAGRLPGAGMKKARKHCPTSSLRLLPEFGLSQPTWPVHGTRSHSGLQVPPLRLFGQACAGRVRPPRRRIPPARRASGS